MLVYCLRACPISAPKRLHYVGQTPLGWVGSQPSPIFCEDTQEEYLICSFLIDCLSHKYKGIIHSKTFIHQSILCKHALEVHQRGSTWLGRLPAYSGNFQPSLIFVRIPNMSHSVMQSFSQIRRNDTKVNMPRSTPKRGH